MVYYGNFYLLNYTYMKLCKYSRSNTVYERIFGRFFINVIYHYYFQNSYNYQDYLE